MARADDRQPQGIYPPFVIGSRSTQSLGRWIDNLLGDKKIRERARRRAEERERRLRNTPASR
jgi:hypothetical protein